MISSKVGSVTISHIDTEVSSNYGDGDEAENYLLQAFKEGLTIEERERVLATDLAWPIRYNLTPERKGLIDWYEFPKGSRIFEIGAGCGSITEALVSNLDCVIIANELSERRALINAHRNSFATNLKVLVGNFYNYVPAEKFDFVICVDVFKHAESCINTKLPYDDFLRKAYSLLKPSGRLLLATENQVGLKYLAGAEDDSTKSYGSGLNDYPQKKAAKTFGKKELEKKLESAGFNSTYFYYPFPDHQIPKIIFSDDYYPGLDDIRFPKSLLPTHTPNQQRQLTFSEQGFVAILERNNLYRELANSFLVEARRG